MRKLLMLALLVLAGCMSRDNPEELGPSISIKQYTSANGPALELSYVNHRILSEEGYSKNRHTCVARLTDKKDVERYREHLVSVMAALDEVEKRMDKRIGTQTSDR